MRGFGTESEEYLFNTILSLTKNYPDETFILAFWPDKGGIAHELITPSPRNVICDFIKFDKGKHKKRCELCCERQCKRFVTCGKCNNKICQNCYENCMKRDDCYYCPYCRNNLYDHIKSSFEVGVVSS